MWEGFLYLVMNKASNAKASTGATMPEHTQIKSSYSLQAQYVLVSPSASLKKQNLSSVIGFTSCHQK